jgi:hypothetical protein
MIKSNHTLRRIARSGLPRLLASMAMVFWITGIGLPALLLGGSSPALTQEAISTEEPPPQLGEEVTPMDTSFQEQPSRPGLFPWLKVQMKDAPPFFRDMKLDINLRTYYLNRSKFDNSNIEAWALGGSIAYRSGWLLNHFGIGATLYTSQPLYAPEDRDGTLLLKPGQEGYTVLGQLYARVKLIEDNFINIYQYEYNTPYLNKNDSRMTPNTFEGYTFTGAYGGKDGLPKFTYGAGYIDKIKPRNSDTFISMSEAAGTSSDVKRGVYTAGANVAFPAFSIGAIDYYSSDIINIGYAEATFKTAVTEKVGLSFAAQFTDQRSVGSELLKGYSFSTNQTGVKAETSIGGGLITLAYTLAATGADLQNPWSSFPGYTSVQVQDFNRAGENALMVKGSYDFSKLGLGGLTAYGLWVHGWGAVNPSTKADVYQQDEYDCDLQWRPKSGILKGLWFRLRYAHIVQRGAGNATMDDIRAIINYDFSLL